MKFVIFAGDKINDSDDLDDSCGFFLDYAMIEIDGRKPSIRFMANLIVREYRIEIW